MSKTVKTGLTTLEERIGFIGQLLDNMKAAEIVVLDLRGISDFADAFVIATVRSTTHMQALARHVMDAMREQGLRPICKPDDDRGRWTLLDYGDVIIHLMDADARSFYDLDNLWGDAQQLAWQRVAMA